MRPEIRHRACAAASALLEGRDCGLPLADGYPHADTLDGLRMLVEHGGPDDGVVVNPGPFVRTCSLDAITYG